MPYNAMALSPKDLNMCHSRLLRQEGLAAFVPKAKNVATILEELSVCTCTLAQGCTPQRGKLFCRAVRVAGV